MDGIRYRLRKIKRVLRKDDENEFVYVFNHIPKIGGTAVRYVFDQWHAVVSDYRRGGSVEETQRFQADKLDLLRIRRPAFVCGHYGLDGSRLHERYPEIFGDPRYRLITFLRDPLDLAISTYFYVKKLGHTAFSENIDKYLMHYRTNYASYLNYAGGPVASALDAYWFVGVSEELDESLACLASMLAKPRIAAPILNETERTDTPNDGAVQIFRRNNQLDYEIYESARERLDHVRSQLRRQGKC